MLLPQLHVFDSLVSIPLFCFSVALHLLERSTNGNYISWIWSFHSVGVVWAHRHNSHWWISIYSHDEEWRIRFTVLHFVASLCSILFGISPRFHHLILLIFLLVISLFLLSFLSDPRLALHDNILSLSLLISLLLSFWMRMRMSMFRSWGQSSFFAVPGYRVSSSPRIHCIQCRFSRHQQIGIGSF